MFEYLNFGALVVLVLLTLFSIPKRKGLSMVSILLILSYVLLLLAAYSSYSDATNNIRDFKNSKALICFSGGGLYTSSNRYYVEKSEGWVLSDNYFVKNSLMIRADNCKKQ